MAWTLHGKITLDALGSLGWNIGQINKVVKYINEVDLFLGHGRGVCHRTGKYQKEFELYGGRACPFPGGELNAAEFLEKAEKANHEDCAKALKHLGYSLHFIQDALCPEHIFPFQENAILGPFIEPHWNFMLYSGWVYPHRNWPKLARDVLPVQIMSPDDLRVKLIEAADWIRDFPCSYWRNDGIRVVNPKAGDISFFKRWRMSDEYIGKWIERMSGLTKGAVNYFVWE